MAQYTTVGPSPGVAYTRTPPPLMREVSLGHLLRDRSSYGLALRFCYPSVRDRAERTKASLSSGALRQTGAEQGHRTPDVCFVLVRIRAGDGSRDEV